MNARFGIMILSFFILTACDDRHEALKDLNDGPAIILAAEKEGAPVKLLKDSVKLSKQEYAYSPFFLEIADNNQNIKHVRCEILEGRGTLFLRNEDITAQNIPVIGNKVLLRFVPENIGKTIVRFIVEDRFSLKDSATLELTNFSNLAPIANLKIDSIKVVDPYEYLLDATNSYDGDEGYGGVIQQYIFKVNNEIIETIEDQRKYIFPGKGTYHIKLQVRDNDGQLSKEISVPLIIN